MQVVGRSVADCNPERMEMLILWNKHWAVRAGLIDWLVTWFQLQIAHISAFVGEQWKETGGSRSLAGVCKVRKCVCVPCVSYFKLPQEPTANRSCYNLGAYTAKYICLCLTLR